SIMRRYLRVPQLAAVMGPCIAGGAYLPALSDVILMVDGTSFMGLGGPNLVKGATGQTTDAETLGGAHTHTAISGVAHYRVPDDHVCITRIRSILAELPHRIDVPRPADDAEDPDELPARPWEELYSLLPDDHRHPYEVTHLLDCLLDGGRIDEFQAEFAPEILCG